MKGVRGIFRKKADVHLISYVEEENKKIQDVLSCGL